MERSQRYRQKYGADLVYSPNFSGAKAVQYAITVRAHIRRLTFCRQQTLEEYKERRWLWNIWARYTLETRIEALEKLNAQFRGAAICKKESA